MDLLLPNTPSVQCYYCQKKARPWLALGPWCLASDWSKCDSSQTGSWSWCKHSTLSRNQYYPWWAQDYWAPPPTPLLWFWWQRGESGMWENLYHRWIGDSSCFREIFHWLINKKKWKTYFDGKYRELDLLKFTNNIITIITTYIEYSCLQGSKFNIKHFRGDQRSMWCSFSKKYFVLKFNKFCNFYT